MEQIIGIYKVTSPNNKIYIGQSRDVNKRFVSYRNLHCKTQPLLYRSLKKHGVDKHMFEIIHICDIGQLNELEKYYIDLYKSFNSNLGLNLVSGGKQQVIISDIYRSNLSKAIRNSAKTKGRVNRLKIPVVQLTLNSEYVAMYESSKDAGIKIGLSGCNITRCINNKRRTVGGFIWKKEKTFNKNIKYTLDKITRPNARKKIDCYSSSGKLLKTFNSIIEAKIELNVNHISDCCSGTINQTKGYVFKYN